MKIKADTRIYLSELGAKGFLYPSEKFVTTEREMECEMPPLLYIKEHGLTPIRLAAKIGEDRLSQIEHSIFWVDKTKVLSS
jgi:hypothetical protein